MRYGKHCLSLNIIAALSIFMAIINQPLAIIFILAYALLVEKDIWLIKYVIHAILFIFISVFFELGIEWIKQIDISFIKNNVEDFKNGVLLLYKLIFAIFIPYALQGKEIKNKFIEKHIKKDNK